MEDLEKKIQSNNKKEKYQLGKLYNESYKEKFKSLNNKKTSSKEWHNTL